MSVQELKENDRLLRIKAKTLTCRHFNGTQHDCCEAGVNYRGLAGEPSLGCMTHIPCLPGFDPKHGPMAECVHRSVYTQAEAEQAFKDSEAAMERHLKAFRAAHDDAKSKGLKRGHGGHSEVPCPICGGVIQYAVASVNGHMHACCSTGGCVQWME